MAEMKAGYKQTDIGVIPEDWDVAALGNLFEITSSKRVFQNEWRKSGVPFYRARELAVLGEKGKVDNDLFIDQELYEKHKRSYGVPQAADVLVTGVGTLGKMYVVPDETEFYFKDGNIIWFKIKGKLNSYFLKQLYYTPLIKYQISEFSAGSTVGTYTITGAKKTLIPLPKPEEQKQIAAALSDVDGLIEALSQLIAKKRDMKTATMQQLLTGKKRLPGFDGEWAEKTLKEIAPLQRGFDLPKSQIEKGNIPVAYSNGVMSHHNKAMVKGPGVYTGRSGTIGKVNYIASDYWPHNTSLWVTTFFDNDPKFVFYLYSFIGFSRFSSGSGVPTLNRNDAHDFRCFIPQRKEQKAIATILSDMDSEIDSLEQRLAKARCLKTGMMQELLTGKTRFIKTNKKQEAA